jgi:hypothetical protein
VTSRTLAASLTLAAAFAFAGPASAVLPSNWQIPPHEAEERFRSQEFKIRDAKLLDAGVTGAFTFKAEFPDGKVFKLKWKTIPRGGDGWNNSPRKEMAAYVVQKWFVDEEDYIVATLAPRCLGMEQFGSITAGGKPTFKGLNCVLGMIAIWMVNLEDPWPFFEEDRFRTDPQYARFLSDLNVLTYLIRHRDGRRGNFLRSTDLSDPRVYSVDNGISHNTVPWNFLVPNWNVIRVPWLRKETVERLRKLKEEDIEAQLGVLAEMRTDADGGLHLVENGPNLDPEKGVRVQKHTVQFGLDDEEIDDLQERLEKLLEDVDAGKIKVQ